MSPQSMQPANVRTMIPPHNIAGRFVEALYHSTYVLAETTQSAVAFHDKEGIQWLAADNRCPCSSLTSASSPCPAPLCHQGRICESFPVNYEGRPLGTVLVCHEPPQQPLHEAFRQLIHAALRLTELEEENESLVEELSASWESLEAVYEISADMRLLRAPMDILQRIAAKARTIQPGLRAVLWHEQGGLLRPLSAGDSADLDARPTGEGLVSQVLSQRQAIVLNGRARIQMVPGREREFDKAVNIAITPVATRQGVLGALAVWQEQVGREFDSHTLRLMETLALQAAMVIENERLHRESLESERLRQEIQIGSEIQQMLLLGEPPEALPHLAIAACTIPSQRVDGDFYEFIPHHERCLDVIVGDVMGKGIPAALLGAATKSHFLRAIGQMRSTAASGQVAGPAEIVAAVSAAVTRQLIDIESFVTLCYARLDLDARRLELVDCGHTRTLLYRQRSGTCEFLQGKNLPLGVVEGETYEPVATSIDPGDVMLFYSDGVTESHDAAGHAFGEGHLAALLQAYGRGTPGELLAAIRARVSEFSCSMAFVDDFTCVAVKIGTMTPSSPIVLECTSDLSELARIRDFIRHLTPLPPQASPDIVERVQALVQAVNEAVTNIAEHAYRGASGQPIHLEADVDQDRITVRIYDWGEPFDSTAVEPPAFDGSKDSGFGVYIIARSVDAVRYERDAQGRNCISLTKLLR